MPKTVNELATRTLQKLFVVEGSAVPEAEDAALVIDAFNEFIDGLFADGYTLTDEASTPVALVEGTEYTSSSTFPLKPRYFDGIAAILAVKLQTDFGAQVSSQVSVEALKGKQRLHAAFGASLTSKVDRALRRLPSSLLWSADT